MLKVGLVGVGTMGSGHLAVYQRLEREGFPVRLVALCDVDPKRFEIRESTLNIKTEQASGSMDRYRLYSSIEDMLDSEQLDYVDMALPIHIHSENAVYALRRGVHVLSEKPMAYSVEQCDDMVRAARETGKTLMVAQCLRFWPAYLKLKEIIDGGDYGQVVAGTFFRGGASPKWSYQNWLLRKECSGGALLDQHVHDVDTIHWLFGMPAAVSCLGRNVIPGSGYDVVSTNYVYPDGKVVNAQDDWTLEGVPFRMTYRVNMEKGAVLWDGGPVVTLYPAGGEKIEYAMPSDDGYYNEIVYFCQCLEKGAPPDRCLPEDTRDTIAIAMAEWASADSGGALRPVV